MEWLVIVILLVLSFDNVQPHGASNLGLSGSTTSYRGFKLLRMDTAGLRDQKFLYDFLLPSEFYLPIFITAEFEFQNFLLESWPSFLKVLLLLLLLQMQLCDTALCSTCDL